MSRLIATRLVRPGEPRPVIYEMVMHEDMPVGWPPELIRDLAGPFVMEQRVLPDGHWVRVASGSDGFRSALIWDNAALAMADEGSEFDRRAQAWVRQKFGVTPDLGSVTFDNDCAAYASGGWATADVSWTVNGHYGGSELSSSAWQYEWTQVIRELVEIDMSECGEPM